jgi:hypothetical protein
MLWLAQRTWCWPESGDDVRRQVAVVGREVEIFGFLTCMTSMA